MKNESKTTSAGGVGFCGLLTVAFIVLKLCGVIDWSWWWVLAPTWIPLAIVAVIVIAVVVVSLIVVVAEEVRIINEKRRRGQ